MDVKRAMTMKMSKNLFIFIILINMEVKRVKIISIDMLLYILNKYF